MATVTAYCLAAMMHLSKAKNEIQLYNINNRLLIKTICNGSWNNAILRRELQR